MADTALETKTVQVFEASSGARIFRLPLDVFPAYTGYAHLVEHDGRLTLVDVGSGFGSSHDDLLEGLAWLQAEYGVEARLSRIDRIIITHGHIDHFALDVLDVESAIAALQHGGAELEGSTPDGWVPFPLWAHGVRYVFLQGPGGEKIELNERLDLDPSRRDDNLGGWSHLGIPTADVERSRRFYADLGFEEALYQEVPLEEGVAAISMMEINGFMLELYRLPGFEADTLAALPDGIIDHIALDVLDADAAYHELKQAGLELLEAVPVELPLWEHGVKYFNVRGPNGEKVEFNQVIRS